MCLKWLSKIRANFALHLSLRYTSVFAVTLSIVLLAVYLRIATSVIQSADRTFKEDIREFREMRAVMDLPTLAGQLKFESKERGEAAALFRILSPDGKVLAATDESNWSTLSVEESSLKLSITSGNPVLLSVPWHNGVNYIRVAYADLGGGLALQLASSLRHERVLLNQYRVILIVGGMFVTLLSGLVAYCLARRAMKRVLEITGTVTRITNSRQLKERVQVDGVPDEIHELAVAFNLMLEKIDQLILGSRQLIDHIAHELRSPLTRARGAAEVELKAENLETKKLASNTIEELDRLSGIITTLLDISAAESGSASIDPEIIDLNELVGTAVELFGPVAEQAGIDLRFSAKGLAQVLGKRDKLQLVFSNILDNAIKYTKSGEHILVSIKSDREKVEVIVADSGRGISPESLPQVFERFYRSKESAKETTGHGLGLSLSKAIIESYGGTIALESEVGKGTIVSIILPETKK